MAAAGQEPGLEEGPDVLQLLDQFEDVASFLNAHGVDTASLLPTFRETEADVIGLDWRIPLDEGWRALGSGVAVQGNLDPIALFAPEDVLRERVHHILRLANGRPGHIFNLGHGILPGTPVENVVALVDEVHTHRR